VPAQPAFWRARVLTSYEAGSFLLDRLGAGLVIDQDLAVVLLDLRRRLIEKYGDTSDRGKPALSMPRVTSVKVV